jgi:hypothetical protein
MLPGTRKCSICPSPTANVFILIGFITLLTIVIVILVRSSLNSAIKEKNYLSVFFRIMLNHLQIVNLLRSFDFNWPDSFKSFYQGLQPMSDSQSQIFSIDCIVQRQQLYQLGELSFIKTLFLSMLPLGLSVISVLIWYLIYFVRRIFFTNRTP